MTDLYDCDPFLYVVDDRDQTTASNPHISWHIRALASMPIVDYDESMKKLSNIFKKRDSASKARKQLEQKAVEGARHAVREYKAVFDRLAEYDRA